MARFLSLRVAPGVRLSASSRGLRGHLGPRAARLHVGGGRTGVSTGAGPVTLYESVGSMKSAARPAAGPAVAQPDDERTRALAAFDWLGSRHRAPIEPVSRQIATLPALPDFRDVLAEAERQALTGLGLMARAERRTARESARAVAEGWAVRLLDDARGAQHQRQRELDLVWQALLANEPEAVVRQLVGGLKATGISAVGDVEGDAVTLRLLLSDPDAIPDRIPGLTPTGRPSMKKASKTLAAQWHRVLVSGDVLLAARHAFALAPALQSVKIVGLDAGEDALIETTLTRATLQKADLNGSPWPVLERLARSVELNPAPRTGALRPLG
jgi:hypothetical protein